jgi:hypothetical protein
MLFDDSATGRRQITVKVSGKFEQQFPAAG